MNSVPLEITWSCKHNTSSNNGLNSSIPYSRWITIKSLESKEMYVCCSVHDLKIAKNNWTGSVQICTNLYLRQDRCTISYFKNQPPLAKSPHFEQFLKLIINDVQTTTTQWTYWHKNKGNNLEVEAGQCWKGRGCFVSHFETLNVSSVWLIQTNIIPKLAGWCLCCTRESNFVYDTCSI